MWWPYVWIAVMLGLIVATIVVAVREKKARKKAIKELAPQPLGDPALEGPEEGLADEGFGFDDMQEVGDERNNTSL